MILLESDAAQRLTKKERLNMTRERDKLERALGGIKDMGGIPDLFFVIDTNKEKIAIDEARPTGHSGRGGAGFELRSGRHHLPGSRNDDAGRALALYCDLIARAAIDGISRAAGQMGVDTGAAEAPIEEPALTEEKDAAA